MKKFNKDKIEEWLFRHQIGTGWACIIGCSIALLVALIINLF